jgi:hypothetical protein
MLYKIKMLLRTGSHSQYKVGTGSTGSRSLVLLRDGNIVRSNVVNAQTMQGVYAVTRLSIHCISHQLSHGVMVGMILIIILGYVKLG